MFTVDTYIHASKYWGEPIEVVMFQMAMNNIEKAVIVSARSVDDWTRGTFDNEYLIECTRRFPGRFAMIPAIDTRQPDAPQQLAYWKKQGAEGSYLYARERSPGKDPLAIWRKADELKLPVSCPGTTDEFASDEFRRIVETFPKLPIMIEHLAILSSLQKGKERVPPKPPYTNFKKALELSKYPNVYMKISGLGEFMTRPIPDRIPTFDLKKAPPYIDLAVKAFGAERVMLGSNYYPVSYREGYANVWHYLREYISRYGAKEQQAMLGGNSLRLFKFGQGG